MDGFQKRIFEMEMNQNPYDEEIELTENEKTLIYHLSNLISTFGEKNVKKILYWLLPDDSEYNQALGKIEWTVDDILRAIHREKELKRQSQKKRRYNTPTSRLIAEWKYRYDNYQKREYESDKIDKHPSFLKTSEWLTIMDDTAAKRREWEFDDPNFVIEKAKHQLSRTSFWRFRKEIEKLKEKK